MIHLPQALMDGVIIIDKPKGCTSHDVVLRIRRLFQTRRVGHCGTLDPDATGVLLVALGRGTRFFPYLSKQDKAYDAVIRLGFSTDSYDASGNPTSEDIGKYPTRETLKNALRNLEGEIRQLPPAFSAKKIGGKPMYKLARAGRDFPRQPSPVFVKRFRLLDYDPPFAACETVCSSGTYVRSLAHDLGQILGCGAHLQALRRTAVGPYSVRDALSLSRVEEAAAEGRAAGLLIQLEDLLPEFPCIVLGPEDAVRVRNGMPLPAPEVLKKDSTAENPSLVRLFSPSGKLLAVARLSPEGDRYLPTLVILRDP